MIAVIPVRSGSKRLPGKNLMKLEGVSLTGRAVKTAVDSGIFERVFVSTDSAELADEAKLFGAEVPFLRPKELAGDSASSVDVLIHALTKIYNSNIPDYVCLIQATSPFLRACHLKEAYETLVENAFTSMSSMVYVSQYIEWQFEYVGKGSLVKPANPCAFSKSSSQIPKRLIENGAFYFIKANHLLLNRSLYDFENHGCYVMGELDSIDIDTECDFKIAEAIIKSREFV